MPWTKQDTENLKEFRNIIDSDDIKIKEQIKSKLLNNKNIIHVLNSSDIDEDESSEYFGTHILPYYIVHPTQHNVKNYICYEVQYDEVDSWNDRVKYLQIVFYILCEQKNLIDQDTYLARHDLLAALIVDEFNLTNIFGKKVRLITDKPSVVDADYACRTLIFEQITDNNLVKTKNGIPRLINKDVVI